VLVNNAAFVSIKQYDDIDEEEWDKAVNTNAKVTLRLTQDLIFLDYGRTG
jgi:NADP-dependent 3-hydroxy acid dehydrogenase YdfG